MKKIIIAFFICFFGYASFGQLLETDPVFPKDNSNITITANTTFGNKGLADYSGEVYVHLGVITDKSSGAGDWKYVKFAWGTTDAAAKATSLGGGKYEYKINGIRSFFGVPAGEVIKKIAIIFRSADGNKKLVNSDGSDMFITIYPANEFAVKIVSPFFEPRYEPWPVPLDLKLNDNVLVKAYASEASNLSVKYNNTVVQTATNNTEISKTITLNEACAQDIEVTGTSASGKTASQHLSFFIGSQTTTAPLPAGLQPGINYAANGTEVTLVLFAPGKKTVSVIGDFNNWTEGCSYQLTKSTSGDYFFIRITGLTAGKIYGFQYVVDGNLKVSDPYTELVLDPWNDQYISNSTFPNLPPYPTGKTTGIVGTLQTKAPAYNWTSTGYSRPAKTDLVIYELLLRDFLANCNWQTLADTLNYLKKLGINAIEVMPFNEFDGNNSWGYNPSFFFAPDKAYGTKNNLKKFIDMAHAKGMAVIMDAVWNHATGSNPWAQMWWNGAANQTAADNPYFNQTATHPFNVFHDFNHESEATKYAVSRFIRFWMTEYKIDGFRWDLSKGFTQKNTGSDVAAWSAKDDSRINIWKRYYDSSQVVSSGSYQILEHFADNAEEKILADAGMLLWGNMNHAYAQNVMGYADQSSLTAAYFANRSFSGPNLVTYAESHDEERITFKALEYGAGNGNYNVKELATALARLEAMQPMLLLIPGPKMIWQFGELGYDKPINLCEDGSIKNECRTNPKPILWNYFSESARKKVYDVISKLNELRAKYPEAFRGNTMTGDLGGNLTKHLVIEHSSLKLFALSNFALSTQKINVTVPVAGTYINYFTGEEINISSTSYSEDLSAGGYKVYVYKPACVAAAPTTSKTTIEYCENATASALTAIGTSLKWYNTETGGTALATAPVPVTSNTGTVNYYVTQTINGCESSRLKITVNVTSGTQAPVADAQVHYCLGAAASSLTATGENLKWYTVASGGSSLASAPIPVTNVAGTTDYFVSQSGICGESSRSKISVIVAAPLAVQNLVASNITQNSFDLSWLVNTGTFYFVEYRKSGMTSWNSGGSSASGNATLKDLEPETTYEYRISSNCTNSPSDNFISGTVKTMAQSVTNFQTKNGISLSVSANPLITSSRLVYKIDQEGNVGVQVINSAGKVVWRYHIGNKQEGTHTLDLGGQLQHISKGVYFLKLVLNNETNTIRFIK